MIIITYRWSSVAVVMSGSASRVWRLFNLLVKQIVVVEVVVVPVVCPQCRSSRGGSLRCVSCSGSRLGCGGSRTSSPSRDRNAPCTMGGCGQSVQNLLEPNVKLGV